MQCRARQPAAWGVRQNLPYVLHTFWPPRDWWLPNIALLIFFLRSKLFFGIVMLFIERFWLFAFRPMCSAVIAICNCGSIKLYSTYTHSITASKLKPDWTQPEYEYFLHETKKYNSSVSVISLECLCCISAMSQKCLSSQLHLSSVSILSLQFNVSALSQHCLSTASALSQHYLRSSISGLLQCSGVKSLMCQHSVMCSIRIRLYLFSAYF